MPIQSHFTNVTIIYNTIILITATIVIIFWCKFNIPNYNAGTNASFICMLSWGDANKIQNSMILTIASYCPLRRCMPSLSGVIRYVFRCSKHLLAISFHSCIEFFFLTSMISTVENEPAVNITIFIAA